MNKGHVFVVEDEKKIADLICKYLYLEGYRASHFSAGKKALAEYPSVAPDLVVLDIMLPDVEGTILCRQLRDMSDVPIILLTAKVEEIDRLIGFQQGADDYVCKPFSPKELMARINALIWRSGKKSSESILDNGGLRLDPVAHSVSFQGKFLKLTQNEFLLLQSLMQRPEKVFTRQELLVTMLGQYYDGYERNIDSHIKNLRKKLAQVDPDRNYIVSVYGVGYKLS